MADKKESPKPPASTGAITFEEAEKVKAQFGEPKHIKPHGPDKVVLYYEGDWSTKFSVKPVE